MLEVGLGGRLDATNLVDAGVAILCSVGIDHRDWLGDTLEAIGAEKAGIFRAGQPVVLGRGPMPASVEAKIADLGCEVKRAAVDFEWHVHADGLWDFRSDRATLERLPPPALAGVIQYQNAACALMAFDLLAQGARPIATRLDATATREALRNAVLPGRLQIVPGEVEWIFDVAHNEPAAVVLAAELGRRPVVGKTLAVFGMLGDKDISAVAAQLDPHIDHWLLASLDGPRALSAEALRQRMGPIRGSVQQCGSVEEATSSAARRALAGDRVLVCGSFQTVGPALRSRALY